MNKEMINQVAERLGAEVTTVNKNGIDKLAITVREGNVGAVIYPESIEAETIDKAVEQINKIVDAHREEMQRIGNNADFFADFEQIKPRLRVRLYNKKVPAEVKRSAEEYGFDDLIIVPYVLVDSLNTSKGTIKVLKNHLLHWGVSAKEVIDIGLQNTESETTVMSLVDVLKKSMGGSPDFAMPDIPNEYVVSTDGNMFGAAGILSKISYFKKKFPNGFYVLPSSLHEIIVHAATGAVNELEDLTKMVQEVNRTTVDPEEVLADKAYAFVK